MPARRKPFSPAQLAAQARFAAMARARARGRSQGGRTRRASAPALPRAALTELMRQRPPAPGRRPLHIIATTAIATAAAAAGAAAAALAGDSLVTRNFRNPRIIAAWGTQNTNAGFAQLTYPTGHDTTRGYRVGVRAGPTVNPELILPVGMQLPLTPQEVIAVTLAGNAVAGDVEQVTLLTAYDEDQGQRWESWDTVRSRMRELTTVEATLTAVAGGYSAGEAISADSDLLLANRDYAWLGCSTRVGIHAVGMVGPDTGNDRLLVPGTLRYDLTHHWWPLITGHCPVINSGNRAATNLICATDENAANPLVTHYLALLA